MTGKRAGLPVGPPRAQGRRKSMTSGELSCSRTHTDARARSRAIYAAEPRSGFSRNPATRSSKSPGPIGPSIVRLSSPSPLEVSDSLLGIDRAAVRLICAPIDEGLTGEKKTRGRVTVRAR